VQFIKTDTTSWSAQVAGFKAAIAFAPSKTVDLVIASAGVTSDNIGSWLEKAVSAGEDPEVPSSVAIDINLRAVYHTTHLALYYFKKTLPESGTGSVDKHLIFISSIAGYVALNNSADYNASKFGVRGLWKAIRQSNSILGDNATFRTNLIAPTFIDTPLTQSIQPVLRKSGFDIATVEDVVAGIMRAACDEEVSGRAIAIAAGKSTAGDSNFDLRDDFDGLDAGQVMKDKISDGTYGGMQHLGKAYFRK
jgi:5'-hydroxyaverantin dehydrogenase